MPRYLTAYIDPRTGRERIGTGPDAQCFHRYANVRNVIRFGLRKDDAFPPGQYNIYHAPERSFDWTFVTVAYKRV